MNQNQINKMMKQVQRMQSDMAQAQESLLDETVTGTAGGGVVVATANGSGQLQSIKLDESVVDPEDIEMLQDLIVAAVNEADRAAQALQQERMGAVTGGMDMGALGGLLG
ncbi:MAG: YbaB/EbfC family nucleoid-associated protein [Actinobacteria bacterium]|nr:YbaB/EbfC family nucleoid-associated protein [Actinomycetota bacterium]MCB9390365.1 YbaB/EbfC family nucleoid-associated protein [Acidimicrobiia bacterium]